MIENNTNKGNSVVKKTLKNNQRQHQIERELESIREKERSLTEEIIKNSLVKENGRFNYEALAKLNEIVESKKRLKKRFGVEG